MTYASHARVITGIIQANLIHLSIKMTTPHQLGAPFVGERVFQNRGVCGQAFLSFPSPTPFLPPSCSRPVFRASRTGKTKTRSPSTGTLATQAGLLAVYHDFKSQLVKDSHGRPHCCKLLLVCLFSRRFFRTARSSPGTSRMEARLVRLRCFVLTGKSCFVVDLVFFISLCLRVAVSLNVTRRDTNLLPFTS